MPIRVAINGFGRAGEGGRLVRQRVGLLEPTRRARAARGGSGRSGRLTAMASRDTTGETSLSYLVEARPPQDVRSSERAGATRATPASRSPLPRPERAAAVTVPGWGARGAAMAAR